MSDNVLLSIRDLTVEYHTRLGVLTAVDNITLDIQRGEVLGLVGESGCGKSTLGRALLRMIQPPGRIVAGHLVFEGTDLMRLSPRQMRDLRGRRISMIFQDPMTSLNPVQRIVDHVVETIRTHRRDVNRAAAEVRAAELADRLGILANRLTDHPHQFSGGMRQRVMIELALALNADLVIADEATTSLDVLVEAQFLDLMRELREEFSLTILMITHNIGVVAEFSDRVAVMYAGQLIELADVYELFAEPLHPYTQSLLAAVPNIKLLDDQLFKLAGSPPNLLAPPAGCRFHPRCPQVLDRCLTEQPPYREVRPGRYTACWLYEDDQSEMM